MKTLILLFVSLNSFADIVIAKDTTVNNVWNIPTTTILRFETGGRILGSGTINGGVVQAAENQHIFDTSLTVNVAACYNSRFSGRWFGARPSVADNSTQLQKAINTCMDKFMLFIPAGIYNYKTTLLVQSIYQGNYVGCTLRMIGESTFWCANNEGTVLIYTPPADKGFALALQLNKGTEIGNITLLGNYVCPTTPDSIYYNTTYANYVDQSARHYTTQYRGLCIDYTSNQNGSNSGSTGIYVHDFIVGGFSTLIAISRNGTTLNADNLIFERIQFRDGAIGFMSYQGQEKGNTIRGLYSWGSIHTVFQSGIQGNGQGGNYFISELNIAGRCIQPFQIRQTGWGQISISRGFFEGIARIGVITSETTLSVKDCTFDFAYPSQAGGQVLLISGSEGVEFSTCNFRYFGSNTPMKFSGKATYINCFWSGEYQGDDPKGRQIPITSTNQLPHVKIMKAP